MVSTLVSGTATALGGAATALLYAAPLLSACFCGYCILRLYCTVAVSAAATPLGRREWVAVNKKAAEKSAFRRAGRRQAQALRAPLQAAGRGHANRLSLAHSPFAFSFCLPLHYYPTSARLTYVRSTT